MSAVNRSVLRLTAVYLCAFSASSLNADIAYRTVALTGTQAPGTSANFLGFGIPVIDAAGRTAFTGFGFNLPGVWSEGSGTLAMVASSGSQAPGAPAGTNFNAFDGVVLNDSGATAFRGSLQIGGAVTAANDRGIWSEGAGPLALVAREGSQAPGAPVGANFDSFGVPLFDDMGRTAFQGVLKTTGGGVTSANDLGIWSEGSGTLDLVAREGGSAPGGGTFGFLPDPVLSASGRTAFQSNLQAGGSGVYSKGMGSLALVARDGSPAPGGPSGAVFGFVSAPVINAAGRTAFRGNLRTGPGGVTAANDEGIWSEGSGSLALVTREGSQAPGAIDGVNFASFGPPVFNAAGQTAFKATRSTSPNDQGIWSEGGGTLAAVALSGVQAPGAPEGAVFSTLADPVMNGSGRTAFEGFLAVGPGGVTFNDFRGIWAEDSTGQLNLVARAGDLLEVAPGDSRTVFLLNFIPEASPDFPSKYLSGGEDGRPLVFNDDFTLTFKAQFTDGSQGIFTATLVATPTPDADFDSSGGVDAADLALWQMNFGVAPATRPMGDANNDAQVDGEDFLIWQRQVNGSSAQANTANVPEPVAAAQIVLASTLLFLRLRRHSSSGRKRDEIFCGQVLNAEI